MNAPEPPSQPAAAQVALTIRRYEPDDEEAVVALWEACGLLVPLERSPGGPCAEDGVPAGAAAGRHPGGAGGGGGDGRLRGAARLDQLPGRGPRPPADRHRPPDHGG